MTRFGVSAHLDVLERASLITTVKAGRHKLHYLNPIPLVEIQDRWLTRYTTDAARALIALRKELEERPMPSTDMHGKPTTVFAIYIRATPEEVWAALTETSKPRPWLYGTLTRSTWETGTAYEQTTDGFTLIAGEILVAEPPHRLTLTFDAQWDETVAGEPAGILDYRLEPIGEAGAVTKLIVTLADLTGETAATAERDTPEIYSSFKSYLETGEPL